MLQGVLMINEEAILITDGEGSNMGYTHIVCLTNDVSVSLIFHSSIDFNGFSM